MIGLVGEVLVLLGRLVEALGLVLLREAPDAPRPGLSVGWSTGPVVAWTTRGRPWAGWVWWPLGHTEGVLVLARRADGAERQVRWWPWRDGAWVGWVVQG